MARKNLKSINLSNKSGLGFNPLANPLTAPINNSLNNISNISAVGGLGTNNNINNSLLRSQNQVGSNSSFIVQQTEFSGAGDNTIDP